MLAGMLACGLVALLPVEACAQSSDPGALELVDPQVFRACGDPRNLPFSNDKGEGFENKLAELFATKLGKKLSYTYFPQATGFVRMTLGTYRCDIIMGFPQGDDQAQVTVPYYRTTYALVAKRGSGLEDVTAIDDPRLKDKRIGVVARTPPSTNMAINGLLARAKSYPLFVDTRADSSAQAMMDDLARVIAMYRVIFQRNPNPPEIQMAMQFLGGENKAQPQIATPGPNGKGGGKFAMNRPGQGKNGGKRDGMKAIQNEGEIVERRPLTAWETYAQALLFSNEAAYVN